MKHERRIWISVVWIVLGITLFALGAAQKIDEFWSGMGSAFFLVGILQTVRFFRLRKDQDYRDKVTVEAQDERNRFLRSKAWAWTGYLSLVLAAVSSIGLKLAGQNLLSMAASFAVCLMVLVYWVSYLILRKKY